MRSCALHDAEGVLRRREVAAADGDVLSIDQLEGRPSRLAREGDHGVLPNELCAVDAQESERSKTLLELLEAIADDVLDAVHAKESVLVGCAEPRDAACVKAPREPDTPK